MLRIAHRIQEPVQFLAAEHIGEQSIATGARQGQVFDASTEHGRAEEPKRARELIVVGARHPAAPDLAQNVASQRLRQVGGVPCLVQEAARVAQVRFARAHTVAPQPHLLFEANHEGVTIRRLAFRGVEGLLVLDLYAQLSSYRLTGRRRVGQAPGAGAPVPLTLRKRSHPGYEVRIVGNVHEDLSIRRHGTH